MKTSLLIICTLFCFTGYSQVFTKTVEYTVQLNSTADEGLNEETSKALLKALWTQLEQGKLKAYSTDEPEKTLTADEANDLMTQRDTLYVEAKDPPYNLEMKVSRSTENSFLKATALIFVEEWTMSNDGKLEKKVKRIIPVIPHTDPFTGKVRALVSPVRLKNS